MELNDRETRNRSGDPSSAMCGPSLVQVLYIDSNEDDLILTQLGCEHCGAPFKFVLARSVDEAIMGMESVQANGGWLPDLILLEPMMEGRRGLEVLEFLRQQPRLSGIPVLVFTGSSDPALLDRVHELGARCVLEKESTLKAAHKLIQFARRVGLCP